MRNVAQELKRIQKTLREEGFPALASLAGALALRVELAMLKRERATL